MCGIVGLHLRDEVLHSRLGELLTPMLAAMSSRGPDSAGIGLYEDSLPEGMLRWSVCAPGPGYDWDALGEGLGSELGTTVQVRRVAGNAVLALDAEPELVEKSLAGSFPNIRVVSYGRAVEVYKDVGHPAAICDRYDIASRSGYQGLGHTRMATESAVATTHSHPFAAGADLCLVHNGSFSNYATVRRRLTDAGVTFVTDNDSEVAANYLAYETAHGADLGGGAGTANGHPRWLLHPSRRHRDRVRRCARCLRLQAGGHRRDRTPTWPWPRSFTPWPACRESRRPMSSSPCRERSTYGHAEL